MSGRCFAVLAVAALGWSLLKNGKLKRGKADTGQLVRRAA
jgi:hypothetical protein